MLEHLFGSKTRVKLLRLFLGNQGSSFFVREISRKVDSQIHAVRRELENLEHLGIIKSGETPAGEVGDLKARLRKYYQLDGEFFLVDELRTLILKSQFLLEQEFKRRVKQIGKFRYFVLLGMFLGEKDSPIDALIVGTVNRSRLSQLMKQFERELGNPVNYAVMTEQEFTYRKGIGDRFLYNILEGKKIVVMDDLTPAAQREQQEHERTH
ncbi:MAG: hypothetical protein ABIG71_01055 [Candidatus Uhrbacteria bacterium]